MTRVFGRGALVFTSLLFISGACAQDPWIFDAGSENQSGLVFSPDGETAYWAEWDGMWGSDDRGRSTIYMSGRNDDSWSTPQPAPFSGEHSDDDPFVSPDGRWLYFVSDRPADESDDDPDTNIWRYALTGEVDPEYLSVNSPDSEFSPAVTIGGLLYFASDRVGGPGQGDIYMAEASADGFLDAEPLDEGINSEHGEWNVWISPTGQDMIFESSSRPTNVSIPGDLYYSRLTLFGWMPAVPLADLNTANSDLLPRLHPDGKTLYYTLAPIGGHASVVTVAWSDVMDYLYRIAEKEMAEP